MNVITIHSIVEANGKTIKENNMEKKHNIPIGAFVEIIFINELEKENQGVKLYVKKHTRDCDGTPLYSLGLEDNEITMFHGFSETSLKELPAIAFDLTKEELDLVRQWHNAVKDIYPTYFDEKDEIFFKKITSKLT